MEEACEPGKSAVFQFFGLDDDDESEYPDIKEPMCPTTTSTCPASLLLNGTNRKGEKKKRRGGRKNRHRMNMLSATNTHTVEQKGDATDYRHNNCSNNVKFSRLMKELHDRERVRGMDRLEARQLLQDKLLFRGETNLSDIRLRRFCIVVLSKEQFEIGNGIKIPAETSTISMENGKISSILRLVPTADYLYVESGSYEKSEFSYRMKKMEWNPCRMRDSNAMFKMWSHFLDRCLHSLLLVPLCQHVILLDFLRRVNKIRSDLNNRPTVSICLSRVITIEDFLISIQQLSESYISIDEMPTRRNVTILDFGLELCQHFINSMKRIANVDEATRNGPAKTNRLDEMKKTEDGLLRGPPPGLSVLYLTQMDEFRERKLSGGVGAAEMQPTYQRKLPAISRNEFVNYGDFVFRNSGNSFQMSSDFGDQSRFQWNRNMTSVEPTAVQRISQWIENIDLNNMCSLDELEQQYDGSFSNLNIDEENLIEFDNCTEYESQDPY